MRHLLVNNCDHRRLIFYLVVVQVRLLGKKLGIPPEILNRHPFPGPGLAIRVLCGEEPYIERDFSETQVLVRIILDFDAMVKKVMRFFIQLIMPRPRYTLSTIPIETPK